MDRVYKVLSSVNKAAWPAAVAICLWVLAANVSPEFTPLRTELTDVRGFSRGVLNFVVLSRDRPFPHTPWWALVAVATAFALASSQLWSARLPAYASLRRGSPKRNARRRQPSVGGPPEEGRTARRVLAIAAGAFLLAVVLSPHVTPYRVVLAPRTFVLMWLLIAAPRLAEAIVILKARSRLTANAARRLAIAGCGALGTLFYLSGMLQTLSGYGGNYTGFLHLSREVVQQAPFLQERPELARSLVVYDAGYDGQFMYLMAFDPFLQRYQDRPQEYGAFIDDPPYRYGRIGFSLLTRLISAGRPERFPAVMLWLIVAAHLALAALLASIAMRHGLTPLAGLWYLAIPGFMSSLLSALPEALAAVGLVAGLICWETRRPLLAALSFGAALLVRETSLILIVSLLVIGTRDDERRSTRVLGASLIPVAVWRLFTASRLFAGFGWKALFANPGDFGLPFAGLFHLWTAGITREQPASEIAAALVYPPILAAAFALAVLLFVRRRSGDAGGAVALAAVIYAVVAVSLNYGKIWSHLPSGERGTFELFLCLLLLLLERDNRARWARRWLTGLFVVVAMYTFTIAPDAATSRAALLVIR